MGRLVWLCFFATYAVIMTYRLFPYFSFAFAKTAG